MCHITRLVSDPPKADPGHPQVQGEPSVELVNGITVTKPHQCSSIPKKGPRNPPNASGMVAHIQESMGHGASPEPSLTRRVCSQKVE